MRGTQRGLAAAVACLLTAGCGYSVTSNLPPHIRTVAVPIFANRTQEPAVENLISRAVVEAFTTNSGLRVANPEDADAILEGEIVGYQLQPLAFNQAANVRESRLFATLNLRFKGVSTNGPLL